MLLCRGNDSVEGVFRVRGGIRDGQGVSVERGSVEC